MGKRKVSVGEGGMGRSDSGSPGSSRLVPSRTRTRTDRRDPGFGQKGGVDSDRVVKTQRKGRGRVEMVVQRGEVVTLTITPS